MQEDINNSQRRPQISVITLTYNRAKLLPRAIKSVLSQTFTDFELIIVNNSSTDNTEEIIRTFSDPRIIYKKNNENSPFGGKNIGLETARGKYVVSLDDDDEFVPDALQTIHDEFARLAPLGVGIIWFDGMDAESGKYTGFGIRKEDYISYQDYLCGKITGDYQMAIARNVIGNHRFNANLWIGMQNIFLLKLHRDNKAFHIPKVIIKAYREHGQSRISNPWDSWSKHLPQAILTLGVFLNEYGEEIKQYSPKFYGKNKALLGFYQILNSQEIEGRKNIAESFRWNFSFKYGFLFFISFFLGKNQIKSFYLTFFKARKAIFK